MALFPFPGIVNVSFSTASLGRLPQNLSRLPYLESLAASFNMFGEIDAGQLAGLAPYLKILSLSSCMISQLPESFGSMLPSLTELHLSHNSLTQLPGRWTPPGCSPQACGGNSLACPWPLTPSPHETVACSC